MSLKQYDKQKFDIFSNSCFQHKNLTYIDSYNNNNYIQKSIFFTNSFTLLCLSPKNYEFDAEIYETQSKCSNFLLTLPFRTRRFNTFSTEYSSSTGSLVLVDIFAIFSLPTVFCLFDFPGEYFFFKSILSLPFLQN